MELLLKFKFQASHSLSGYEEPHPHIWKLAISVAGQPVQGRILDIITLNERIERFLDRVRGTYLNDNSGVTDEVRSFPTCETLSVFFYNYLNVVLNQEFSQQNPSIKLSTVEVAICDMEEREMGAVRVRSGNF